MKILQLLGLCLLPCAGCGASDDEGTKVLSTYTTQAWDLVSAYERAHKEQNVEHALALMHLGSVDTTTRDTLIRSLTLDFEKVLVSARFLPLKGDEVLEFVIDDRRIVPNLKVRKRLRVEFLSRNESDMPEKSATEYFVGTLNGREMIATACVAH